MTFFPRHRFLLWTLWLIALIAAGCGSPRRTPIGGQVQYFAGSSFTTTPDGSRELRPPTPMLVERVIDPRRGRLIERIYAPHQKLEIIISETEKEGVYSARASDAALGGTMTFSQPPWEGLGTWTYDLVLAAGAGKIQGSGEVDAQGLLAQRMYLTADGQAQVLLRDDLPLVGQEEYRRKLVELTRGPQMPVTPPPEMLESTAPRPGP